MGQHPRCTGRLHDATAISNPVSLGEHDVVKACATTTGTSTGKGALWLLFTITTLVLSMELGDQEAFNNIFKKKKEEAERRERGMEGEWEEG